ncbi:VirB4-like conjugal transfer ATPase, CD1110 family [Bacteroides acidifaciens]|uniref:VirB4-like conjugal transfer ATPase, CD1110 family n=1 Tax=Bacteroides acidifaciens TaxID=85831 RepID=UPI0035C241A0
MGFFSDGFKELKKASVPLYKAPKSIQETIEIEKVAVNGIFEVSKNRYSKCYRFHDINYTTTNEEEQIDIFERYCKFLNSLDCAFKITVNNKNKDMEKLRDYILLAYQGDGYDEFRRIYNDIIEEKIREGRQGIEQERYLTITIERKNFEEAKAQFATIEATVHKAFSELGTDIIPLDGNERLKVLHNFYHLGEEDTFDFDIKNAAKVGADFRNDLCNGMLKYFPEHIEDEGKFVRALFIKKYPSSLSDRFLNEITSLPVHSVTSIDVVPIPKDMTTKVLQKKYLGIESDIIKQQRVRNKNNDFSSEISYAKRIEKKEIEQIMDDVRENDQCMFYVAVTILLVAENKDELESMTESVVTIGKRNSVTIDTHYLKQREALNTALPIGVRQVETMRTMLTQSLAVLLPFNVQELNDEGGNYYGINQISKNVNVGNRKKLLNGNGFIFGVPGSGKSFFAKQEMGNVFLNTGDDVIVIDPMNEYFDIARTFGGAIVNLSAYTKNYVNPLEADLSQVNEKGIRDVIADKSEFMLGLCDQLLGSALNQKHHSIIDRCVKDLYFDAWRNHKVPLMSDFYHILKSQAETEAQELALCLELFVEGSLNIFNHHTNVDEDNRLTVYGIQDLGSQLAPVAMLVMMEAIQSRIIENGRKGRATWLYIDECHVLLNSDYSATYLQQLWKKVRKQGGLCTGISQNVTDLLQNYIAATLISNSEFVALLKQSNIDSAKLAEVIGVSDAQLRFVSNSPSGTGLIKCGSVVIPFDNTIGKDTAFYKLYNTNIHEKIAEGLMDKAEEIQSGFDVTNEESGADTSLIREYISTSRQRDIVSDKPEQAKVEQSAEKYNSWLIY